jgi:hypothetical protein
MKDDGGRMTGMLLNLERLICNSMLFILHPSAVILAFHRNNWLIASLRFPLRTKFKTT